MAPILYLGTDEGVLMVRRDNGSWKVENQVLADWSVLEVAVPDSMPDRLFAATRGDGVWTSEDSGQSWRKAGYGRSGPGKVRCITLDPHNPNRLYAGCEPIDVFVSDDLGQSWERLTSVWEVPWVEKVDYHFRSVEPHVRDIAVDPQDPNKIYAALQVGYMLKSADGGASWKVLNQGVDADVHTIVIDPTNTERIFVATGGSDHRRGKMPDGRALYASTDGGKAWSLLAKEFPQDYSVPLAMHPRDSNVMFSAVANGQPNQWRRPGGAESAMIRTADGGQTWQKVEKGLADMSTDFPEAICFDEGNPDQLYAAFRRGGLFSSPDAGDSWHKVDLQLPSVNAMKAVRA